MIDDKLISDVARAIRKFDDEAYRDCSFPWAKYGSREELEAARAKAALSVAAPVIVERCAQAAELVANDLFNEQRSSSPPHDEMAGYACQMALRAAEIIRALSLKPTPEGKL